MIGNDIPYIIVLRSMKPDSRLTLWRTDPIIRLFPYDEFVLKYTIDSGFAEPTYEEIHMLKVRD